MAISDRQYLHRAMFLAERGRGTTSPNPIVGAVIVTDEDIVVGQGAHRFAGGPHAEVVAIESAGATPVFIDIDPISYTLDVQLLEAALANPPTGRLKAVVPVHLYGHPSDMRGILELAKRYGLYVIEDCAQSHGAALDGRKTGAWGQIAAFSFYPTKNLGTVGDGGMVVTDDAELADRVRLLQQYGWRERYISEIPGTNSRLDELHASILRVKLRHLDAENVRRQSLAGAYDTLLADADLTLPQVLPGMTHAYHQYAVCLTRREVDGLHHDVRGAAVLDDPAPEVGEVGVAGGFVRGRVGDDRVVHEMGHGPAPVRV